MVVPHIASLCCMPTVRVDSWVMGMRSHYSACVVRRMIVQSETASYDDHRSCCRPGLAHGHAGCPCSLGADGATVSASCCGFVADGMAIDAGVEPEEPREMDVEVTWFGQDRASSQTTWCR